MFHFSVYSEEWFNWTWPHIFPFWGVKEERERETERGKMQIKQQWRVTGGPACPGSRGPGPGLGSETCEWVASVRSLSRISRSRYMQLTRPPGPQFVTRSVIGPQPLYTGARSQSQPPTHCVCGGSSFATECGWAVSEWCIKGAVGARCSQEKDAGLSCSHQQAVKQLAVRQSEQLM